ncbi:MAG TPA: histidine--tRNA ligase [Candidatus Paceibacterota bacterium]|nr:histidine--tRNA ligase [Candidatus Paceibacterota bacterium]
MTERIAPQPASGFRDLLPADAAARQQMMDQIADIFRLHGFLPLDTPALEREEVLTGGDPEFAKQIYHARITDEDEPLALRFDLTVPLARYVSAHADDLVFPFRRYHIGNVWRGEHPQAGRYRQFVQCDADIIGSDTVGADADIIALMHAVFTKLGLGEQVGIRISNRKIFDGLAAFLDYELSKTPAVLRAVDRLQKAGWEAVAAELTDKLGLTSQQVDAIQELLSLRADSPIALLDQADKLLAFSARSHEGIEELRALVAHLDALGIPRSAWSIDLSIARGLGYYTGAVFEAYLRGLERYGSICSGGRYDNLVERFSPMKLAGVGTSIGIDRLFAALDELGLVPQVRPGATVAVLKFEPKAHDDCLRLAAKLRDAGIATELYQGHEETLKGQLSWATKRGFPYVAIIGARESEKGVVQLKNMAERTQEEVPLDEVPTRIA